MIKIERHKTAILRRRLSKPVQLLLDDSLLNENCTFLDYGCGKGEDTGFLKKLKIKALGFDPYYRPDGAKVKSSIVNLGYILNVIENPSERKDTLLTAFELAEDLLTVSVMIRDRNILPGEKEYSDGIVTSWNTFQKYYTQKEFREYLQENLNAEIHSAGVGIFYIFKNLKWVEKYLNARMQKRPLSVSVQIRQEEHSRILADWLDLYQELGRIPVQAEFKEYKYIQKYFGSMENAAESMRAEIDQETFFENSRKRKEKLNVSLCRHIIRRNGAPKWKDLSTEEQTDVKMYYSDFNEALNFAMSELKTLSDLSTVSRYISESTVGKVLPDDIYIHSDSISSAPEMLQILVELAKIILPSDFEYNIIKIARNSWHVTFLNYPRFYEDPHPALKDSIKVFLHKNQIGYRDFSSSENPPILHRKETFLHSLHPKYEEYSALTDAEESAGLLSRRDIGTRKGWEKVLKENGYGV